MVKLTTKYLFRKALKKNQVQARRKDESDLEYLKKITHLYLQSQFIDKISGMPQCQSVTVIYLQNNLLRSIHNLDSFPGLTHLYLQHNCISKIKNLSKLLSLKKLYLGHNEISVVEGLEGLKNLTELHVESQRLPQGETLYFDPRTVSHLGKCLKVLDISGNNVTSVLCLEGFMSLTKLFASHNHIEHLQDLTDTVTCLPFLEELTLHGNPVVSNRKFMDAVIVASKSLKILNGNPIGDHTRQFVSGLSATRRLKERRCRSSLKLLDCGQGLLHSSGDADRPTTPGPPLGSTLFPLVKKLTGRKSKPR